MHVNARLGLGLAVVAAAFGATACGDSGGAAQAPSRPADVRGTVTKVESPQDGRPAILIDQGGACALVVYLDDAKVLRQGRDGEVEASVDDFAVGQTVDAWVGAIAESCPEQTQAERIVIVEPAS